MAFSIMNARQKQRFKDRVRDRHRLLGAGPGPVPLQRLPAARDRRPGPARHSGSHPDASASCYLPPVLEQHLPGAARPDPLYRHDRLGQVDHAWLAMIDYINANRLEHIITIEDPDRVPAPRQEVDRQPARGRGRHAGLPPGAARRPCVRTRTSSWSARCATTRPSRRRCWRPRPAISCSRRCTLWTRPRRSTASSRSSHRISRSRSASSSAQVLKAVISHAPGAARRRHAAGCRRSR